MTNPALFQFISNMFNQQNSQNPSKRSADAIINMVEGKDFTMEDIPNLEPISNQDLNCTTAFQNLSSILPPLSAC